jgi:hypothetical protein
MKQSPILYTGSWTMKVNFLLVSWKDWWLFVKQVSNKQSNKQSANSHQTAIKQCHQQSSNSHQIVVIKKSWNSHQTAIKKSSKSAKSHQTAIKQCQQSINSPQIVTQRVLKHSSNSHQKVIKQSAKSQQRIIKQPPNSVINSHQIVIK